MNFLVVSPVYRNPEPIPELARRVCAVPGARLLLVEDGARDRPTLDILRSLADERVGALLLRHNVGQNRAIYAGMSLCRRNEPAVVMDGDLQDQPEAIPLLLAELQRWPAVFVQRQGTYQYWIDRFTSRLFKGWLRWRSGGRLPADVGSFVALRSEVVRYLLANQPAQPYLVGDLARSGFPLGAIPFARKRGNITRYGWKGRLRLALLALGCLPVAATPLEIEEKLGWAR